MCGRFFIINIVILYIEAMDQFDSIMLYKNDQKMRAVVLSAVFNI